MYYENWNIFNYEVEGFDIEGWMVFKMCKIFFYRDVNFLIRMWILCDDWRKIDMCCKYESVCLFNILNVIFVFSKVGMKV